MNIDKETKSRKYGRRIVSPIGMICLEADGEGLTSLYIRGMCLNGQKRYMTGHMEQEKILEAEAKLPDETEWMSCTEMDGREEPIGSTCEILTEDDAAAKHFLDQAVNELQEYFAGVRKEFTVPVHLKGTEFQQKAWNALRQIPYGETRTYSEIAEMIGNPKACRAIGSANNKNPVMLFVPCHRVIGKNGSLVGFAGGLDTKKYLLELEQGKHAWGAVPYMEKTGLKESRQPEGAGIYEGRQSLESEQKADSCLAEQISEMALYHVKRQGEYTLEDYYSLPEDMRVELIDGVFYDMASPTLAHQMVSFEICAQIRSYIKGNGENCKPIMSPLDVRLDCDDKTMVQPDVLVVCDIQKMFRREIHGAPDLVMEVVSASSVRKDTVIKLNKYRNAGVREYWIIDLKNRKVLVYDFENNQPVMIYGMDGEIPVGIYQGACRIDFAAICKELDQLPNLHLEPEEAGQLYDSDMIQKEKEKQ